MLKFALLGFLNYEPMTGYDLKQCLGLSTMFFWQAPQSQIYRTLNELEKDGDIVSHIEAQQDRPDRRVYQITDQGKAAFTAWLAEPIQEISLHKDLLLLKVFFAGSMDRQTLSAQLQFQKQLHVQQGRLYTQDIRSFIEQMIGQHPQLKRDAVAWEATLRFGEMYTQMYIQWLEETIATLEG
jgi:PadR family transcriptional regulator AphA